MDNKSNFYNPKIINQDFTSFFENIKIYQNEILNCNKKIWINWPQKKLYKKIWKIIPICVCVPSNDIKNMKWIDNVKKFLPNIYKYVKSLKNIRSASISLVGENHSLSFHQGWACVANHVLRCHLPIIIKENKSGVVVEKEKRFHKKNECILFDDSHFHMGFNLDTEERYVLIIDFERPNNIPKGISDIEDNEELLKMCNSFNIINNVYSKIK